MAGAWYRLEGSIRSARLEPGIAARVADPLWMLARQWQVGELRGEDASTPVEARVVVEHTVVESVRPEPGGVLGRARSLRAHEPIESAVEAEPGPSDATTNALALGRSLVQALDAAGLASAVASLRARFPVAPPPGDGDWTPAQTRRVAMVSRHLPDGVAVRRALRAGDLDELPPRLTAVLRAWAAESDPAPAEDTWSPAHLAHGFSVAAPTAHGEVVLRARDYAGEHVDGVTFDVAGEPHGLRARAPEVQRLARVPAPVRFAGMPARRWWAFEDGRISFGNVEASPSDVARMLVAQFGVVYGDDWYVVPVGFPARALARVVELEVHDSFGDTHPVPPLAVVDGADRSWRAFELSGDDGPAHGHAPWLPVALGGLSADESEAVERVSLVRDEVSNLGWAIERRVEGPLGVVVDRDLAWRRDSGAPAAASEGWRLIVVPDVPPHQIPLVPERQTEGGATVMLRRGRMPAPDPEQVRPKGRLLRRDEVLRIHEEQLPASGLELTRVWQRVRASDGSVRLWVGRRRRPGKNEPVARARFDVVEGADER